MKSVWRERAVSATVALLVCGAYELSRARAQNVPINPTMFYGVTLERDGRAENGSHGVQVQFCADATGFCALCDSGAQTVAFVHGRGRVALPETCRTAVQSTSNLYVQLTVDGTAVPRSKVGAVPYAVEAVRADGLTAAAEQRHLDRDCPVGYARNAGETSGVICTRAVMLGGATITDEVVKVGTGPAAFWVDRYEAGAFRTSDGMQLSAANNSGGATGSAVETTGLQVNGRRPAGAFRAVALSRAGFPTVNVTWFQANELCLAAGKRLMQRHEWFASASGTDDDTRCNTTGSGAWAAAPGNGCVSAAGVHDMIGNVWEWTEEWYAGVGGTTWVNVSAAPWPPSYTGSASFNDDRTWNIAGGAHNGTSGFAIGMPGAALRGGHWTDGPRSGVFALYLDNGPSYRSPYSGFRCVLRR